MSIKKTTVTLAAALSLTAVPMASFAQGGPNEQGRANHGQRVSAERHEWNAARHTERDNNSGRHVNKSKNDDGRQHVVFPQPATPPPAAPSNGDTSVAAPAVTAPVVTSVSSNPQTQPAPVVRASVKGTDQNNDKFKFSFAGTLEQFGSFLQSVAQFLGLSNGSGSTN